MGRRSWFLVRKRGQGGYSRAQWGGVYWNGGYGMFVFQLFGKDSVSSGQIRIVFGLVDSGGSRDDGGDGDLGLVGGLGRDLFCQKRRVNCGGIIGSRGENRKLNITVSSGQNWIVLGSVSSWSSREEDFGVSFGSGRVRRVLFATI